MSVGYVQSAVGATLSGTVTATLGAVPTKGNLLVAFASANGGHGGGAPPDLSSPATGWAKVSLLDNGSVSGWLYWKIAGTSEPQSISLSVSVATVLSFLEYGPLASAALDASQGWEVVATTILTGSGHVTATASKNAIVVGQFAAFATGTDAITSPKVNGSTTGVTVRNSHSSSEPQYSVFDLFVPSTASSYQGSATIASSTSNVGLLAVFDVKPRGGAGMLL